MRIIVFVLLFLTLPVFTGQVFAHGGFEKRAGITTVYISQDPISPLVGDKVKLRLNFKDETIYSRNVSEENLVSFPVKLSVVDTFYGDASKDKVIFSKNLRTDINGGINFEYTFNKQNYFDIDLVFVDKNGEEQEVGFLIYPRNIQKEVSSKQINPLLSFGIGFIAATLVFGKNVIKKFYRLWKKRK